MKFDWKVFAKRLGQGLLTGIVGALGAGYVEPKQIGVAAIVGGAAAFGIDVSAFLAAKKTNATTQATLQAYGVAEHIIEAATVQTSAPSARPGNV